MLELGIGDLFAKRCRVMAVMDHRDHILALRFGG